MEPCMTYRRPCQSSWLWRCPAWSFRETVWPFWLKVNRQTHRLYRHCHVFPAATWILRTSGDPPCLADAQCLRRASRFPAAKVQDSSSSSANGQGVSFDGWGLGGVWVERSCKFHAHWNLFRSWLCRIGTCNWLFQFATRHALCDRIQWPHPLQWFTPILQSWESEERKRWPKHLDHSNGSFNWMVCVWDVFATVWSALQWSRDQTPCAKQGKQPLWGLRCVAEQLSTFCSVGPLWHQGYVTRGWRKGHRCKTPRRHGSFHGCWNCWLYSRCYGRVGLMWGEFVDGKNRYDDVNALDIQVMQREPVRKLWSTLARRGRGGLVGPELEPCQACHCHLIPSMWEAHFGEGLLH